MARGITDERQRGRRQLLSNLNTLGRALKFNGEALLRKTVAPVYSFSILPPAPEK